MQKDIIIRQEESNDHKSVFNLIESAFKTVEVSDHSEQHLVERLRISSAFIPELSLVAELNDRIVGHILLTKIKIVNDQIVSESLALAPVSVHPDFQNQGIGSKLIVTAHKIAIGLGHQSVVLIGHKSYYPKFGYKQAHLFGISLPFEAPKENCMAIELFENGLTDVKGVVEYPREFFTT